ncbi:hypothetical protein R8Z50_11470 [Longispora sp. K20-0274]|uniref:hypothetical protein n=1 Tax=Longispora sp. K20-0274 TaxID=3088255 RepID=UPI00399BA6A7
MRLRFAFVAAPLLTLTYGIARFLDGLDGQRGSGFFWNFGHLAFLVALAYFAQAFVEIRALLGRSIGATVAAAIGFVGIVCAGAQFAIDIFLGLAYSDREAMNAAFDHIQGLPGVQAAVYDFGPLLFFVGQITLSVLLAKAGRLRWFAPLLVVADLMVPFADKDLIPLGAICLLISYWPLARRTAGTTTPKIEYSGV